MQIQIGCTVRLNRELRQHTLGRTLIWYHRLLTDAMQTTAAYLLFCFYFYTNKPVFTILVTGKKINSNLLCACWFEKNNVVRFLGTYIWHSHIWHIYTYGEKTWTKGQLSHGELTSLCLLIKRKQDSRAGKAKKTGTELNGRLPGLLWGRGWNGLRIAGISKCLTPTIVVGWSLIMKSEKCVFCDGIMGCLNW